MEFGDEWEGSIEVEIGREERGSLDGRSREWECGGDCKKRRGNGRVGREGIVGSEKGVGG